MADWTDGPEYAPAQRPDAFAAPDAPALSTAVAEAPAPAAPEVPPASFSIAPDAVPLDTLARQDAAGRDPLEAFEASGLTREAPEIDRDPRLPLVNTSTGPGGSAWGAAHTAFPPPTTAPIAPAYPNAAGHPSGPPQPATFPAFPAVAPGAPRPVRAAEVLRSVGAGLELLLLLCTWSSYFGPLLLMVAVNMSQRVTVRRAPVRRLMLGVTLGSALLACLGTLLTYGYVADSPVQMVEWWWGSWQALMLPVGLILLVAVNTIVTMGLRNGEEPRA